MFDVFGVHHDFYVDRTSFPFWRPALEFFSFLFFFLLLSKQRKQAGVFFWNRYLSRSCIWRYSGSENRVLGGKGTKMRTDGRFEDWDWGIGWNWLAG